MAKQNGGILRGKSHKNGGIPAIVGGNTPVELEGDEYIIKKSSAAKLGEGTLDYINKHGRIPKMAKGGKVDKDIFTKQQGEDSDYNPTQYKKKKKPPQKMYNQSQYDEGDTSGSAGSNPVSTEKDPDADMLAYEKTDEYQKNKARTKKKLINKENANQNQIRQNDFNAELGESGGKKKKVKGKGQIEHEINQEKQNAELGETGGKKKKVAPKSLDVKKLKLRGVDDDLFEMKKVKPKEGGKKKSKADLYVEKHEKKKAKKKAFKEKYIPWSKEAKALKAKNKKKKDDTEVQGIVKGMLSKKEENPKFVNGGYIPSAQIPVKPKFRQGMKMMGHGGVVSSNHSEAGGGDPIATHSHSGYKAGE